MSKLLKYSGDIKKALRTVNEKMEKEGFEYVIWSNSQTGSRFIAKKETVEKMYLNKFEGGAEVNEYEIIKVSNTSMTLNEMKEVGAGATLKEGWGGKDVIKSSAVEMNLIENILYDENFDCSVLFK